MPGFSCCVPGCFNNNKKERHLRFYEFPKDKQTRKLWTNKVKRGKTGKFSLFKPTTGHRVCSDHFEGGRKTYMVRIPTIFPWKKTENKTKRRLLIRDESVSRSEPENNTTATTSVLKSIEVEHSYAVTSSSSSHLLCKIKEKDKTLFELELKILDLESNVHSLKDELDERRKKCEELTREVSTLQRKTTLLNAELTQTQTDLNDKTFRFQSIKDKPDVVKFYTGFSSYTEFLSFYDFLYPDFPYVNYWGSKATKDSESRRNHKLTPEDQLLLVLSRLRVGLLEEDLAYR